MAPSASRSDMKTVQSFYVALLDELEQAGYDDAEKALLANRRYYYGRYLSPDLRDYFVKTVIPPIAHAVSWVEANRTQQILDLGCGLGMQSIIFASLGAKVLGLDVRKECVALCEKRKAFYEKRLNRTLDIAFVQSNFLEARAEDFDTRFDSVFSMAAFSYMMPLERTVQLISAILKQDAKVYLYEANSRHLLHRMRNSTEPSPKSTVEAFSREGFSRSFLYGACALPRPFWRYPLLNQAVVHPADKLLKKSLPLSFNYVLGMQRGNV